jgi:hypothetical protein
MGIDSETMPSPPSIVHRETYIILDDPIALVDPVVPADSITPRNITRDITIGHKRPAWARQTLQEEEGHKVSQGKTREIKRPKIFSRYLSAMTHIIDS